jgi:hypothetical protein
MSDTTRGVAAAALLALAAAGCGGAGDGDAGPLAPSSLEHGRGAVTVTGAESHQFTARSGYASVLLGDPEHHYFVLDVASENPYQSFAIDADRPGRPAVGTHPLGGSGAGFRGSVEFRRDGRTHRISSHAGELRITHSERGRLAGTATFTQGSGENQVTVTAAFNARCTSHGALSNCD